MDRKTGGEEVGEGGKICMERKEKKKKRGEQLGKKRQWKHDRWLQGSGEYGRVPTTAVKP